MNENGKGLSGTHRALRDARRKLKCCNAYIMRAVGRWRIGRELNTSRNSARARATRIRGCEPRPLPLLSITHTVDDKDDGAPSCCVCSNLVVSPLSVSSASAKHHLSSLAPTGCDRRVNFVVQLERVRGTFAVLTCILKRSSGIPCLLHSVSKAATQAWVEMAMHALASTVISVWMWMWTNWSHSVISS